MQFCPQCDNIMDIGKSVPKINLLNQTTPNTVSSVTEEDVILNIINKYKNKEEINNKNIDLSSLTSHPEFNKLKEADKTKIIKTLNLDTIDESKVAYFICKNCLYNTKLTSQTLVLSRINTNVSSSSSVNLNKYKYMIYDKTLPHTRDYICKNKDCESNKDANKRDAVWFRPNPNSYSTYYGCLACETIWNIS